MLAYGYFSRSSEYRKIMIFDNDIPITEFMAKLDNIHLNDGLGNVKSIL